MLNLNNLVAGQIRSIVHTKDVELVTYHNTPSGRVPAPDWLSRSRITCRNVFKGNVAGRESYGNKMRALEGEDWEAKKKPWFTFTDKPGVVVHKTKAAQYLALLNPDRIKTEYFVDGQPATPAQVETIREWKKSSSEFGVIATFALDSVEYYSGEA